MPTQTATPANDPFITNRYGELCSEIYVLDKPPGALGDIGYYTQALKPLDGPVLEAGCGSGRLMIPLLEAGIAMEGFDRSAHMLAEHRKAADARSLNARLQQATYEDFAYAAPFAAIISPVGTFTLIETYEAALAALRRFHAHLKPGGRLFVDLMPLAYLTANGHDGIRTWTTPTGDLLRLESRRAELDLLNQRLVVHTRYERWRGSRLVDMELEALATRLWGLREFELTLKEAGFGEVTVCGDYRVGRPPGPRDTYWCFQAVR